MDKKVVVFKINGEDLAADIMQVERILGFVEPTKIPEAPSYIKGVIKYQDKILPIMNLKKRFGVLDTESNPDNKIIVVRHELNTIGVIVDAVSEVIDINDNAIESAPEILKGISNKYILGIIKHNDRIITLIDTQKLFTKEELEHLNLLT